MHYDFDPARAFNLISKKEDNIVEEHLCKFMRDNYGRLSEQEAK